MPPRPWPPSHPGPDDPGGSERQDSRRASTGGQSRCTGDGKDAETTDTIVTDWRREIAAVGEATKTAVMVKPDKVEARRTPEAEPEAEIFEDDLTAEPAFEPTHSHSEPTLSHTEPTHSGSEPTPSRSELAHQASGDAPPARPAILSERTGRQVAAAFGELSDAFASRSKKTFDEMAEEMLRPMLQDWLDNNLPTLVERLVREEIERVARGA